MYHRRSRFREFIASEGGLHFIAALVLLLGCAGCLWINLAIDSALGVGGFGPIRQYDVQVVSKHIDAQDDSSSYMVTTDVGTFEVDNGPLLDVYNADVIYGNILANQRYCFTAKGNTVTNYFIQQYPYILKATPGGC